MDTHTQETTAPRAGTAAEAAATQDKEPNIISTSPAVHIVHVYIHNIYIHASAVCTRPRSGSPVLLCLLVMVLPYYLLVQ